MLDKNTVKERKRMELVIKRFGELSAQELYAILQARVDVFVVEQKCPYPEIDGRDDRAYHVYLKDEEGIQAYLRVLEKGAAGPEVAIGRVLAKKRRQGLATQVLAAGIQVAKERLQAEKVVLEAQTYARGLYEKAGFVQTSAECLEDGIPHIQRTLELG